MIVSFEEEGVQGEALHMAAEFMEEGRDNSKSMDAIYEEQLRAPIMLKRSALSQKLELVEVARQQKFSSLQQEAIPDQSSHSSEKFRSIRSSDDPFSSGQESKKLRIAPKDGDIPRIDKI